MIYTIIVLFYLFGGVFMFLKVMKDLEDEKHMPEFFVCGAAFSITLYPVTYPIFKILESRRKEKAL